MLSDSHCHILDPKLEGRASEIVKNLEADGLSFIVEISASPTESPESLAFATKHKTVYCTIGTHPIYANEHTDEFEKWCIAQKGSPKIVAVGECGLDYAVSQCGKELQKEVFISQIKLADKMGLPLVVHSRDAFEDTFAILSEYKEFINNGLLIHCFSYTAAEVEKFKTLDAYFAFGGAITYKNNLTAPDAIRAVPLDRIIVETDCPYLSPVPLRGTVNEPKNVKYVAERIAQILNLTNAEIEKTTLENTKRFYRIKA